MLKEIKLFIQGTCPHCKKCMAIIEELMNEKAEYRDVPLTVIDEKVDQATADKYDYYYVPTFYVNEVKKHEGAPTREAVNEVFRFACGQ